MEDYRMSFFKTSDGVNLYYEVMGSGEHTVIMCNGGSCTTKHNYLTAPVLAQKYRVVLWDYRGHGQSDYPNSPMGAETIARDLHELMEHLHIEKTYLFGWSTGAQLELNYISRYGQDRLEGLIFVDMSPKPMALTEEEKPISLGGGSGPLEQLMMIASFNDRLLSGEEVASMFFSHPEEHQDVIREISNEKFSLPHLIAINMYICTQDYRDVIPGIEVPMLVFSGEHSIYPPACGQYIKDHAKDAEFHIFENCGHALMLEEPEKFNRIVMEFLDKQTKK